MGLFMKAQKRKFTLLELLAVIAIISVLAFALGGALGPAGDKAKLRQAQTVLNSVKTAISAYSTNYGKPPKRLSDLLKDNNPRGISYFDGDEIPKDPFTAPLKDIGIVTDVDSVVKDITGKRIIGGKLDGNGFVVYSVGMNGKPDSGGGLPAGVSDSDEDIAKNEETAKDDISVFVSF